MNAVSRRMSKLRVGARLGACAGIAFFTLAGQVLAQSRPDAHSAPATNNGAQLLFDEGRRALDAKDYVTACEKFRQSNGLEPAAGTLMNWATCEEQLNQLVSASQHWRDAIARLPPYDERTPFADSHLRRVNGRLAYLTLTLTPDAPQGTRVERDDARVEANALDTEVAIDPGAHRIVVFAPRRTPHEYTIVVREREHDALVIAPGPALPSEPVRPAPSPRKPEHGNSTSFTVGVISGGLGLAGVAAATVTGLMLPAKQRLVDENCRNGTCNSQGLAAAADGKRLLVINTTGWVVGAVGLGLGTYLVISGSAGGKDHTTSITTERLAIMPNSSGVTMSYARAF